MHGRESSLDVPNRNWLQIAVRLRSDQTSERAAIALRAVQQDIRDSTMAGVPPALAGSHLTDPLVLTPATGGSAFRERYGRAVVVLLVAIERSTSPAYARPSNISGSG